MEANLIVHSVPAPGQLVEVRRRRWVVANIEASSAVGYSGRPQHAVELTSIEDDALGEQLEVIWEIEPGARPIENAGLPSVTGFDDADKLEAFLDAVRWGAATNADKGYLQAPSRSGISIEDFQLDPLVRAIGMARANLLIADDVGLGKTIEAGLVIQELLLRHRARTVLIVCPASLQQKWQDEMQEKFGLEFRILNTEYVKQQRREQGIHANPWTSFPRLIASMDWMKAGEGLRLLREVLPVRSSFPRKFDMLIVDEAHNVAPSGSLRYAIESLRTKMVREIAPHFQHRLFLTATPHNGYTESFTSLLELLDDQRFSRNILPDDKQLQQVMVRRLKSSLRDKDDNPLYPTRNLQALSIPYTTKERQMHDRLNQYCKSREKRSGDEAGATGTKFVNNLLKKRLYSSPAAFASTLEKHLDTINNGKAEKRSSDMDGRILRKAIQKAEEDYAKDEDFEAAQQEAMEEATKSSIPLTDEERLLLNELRSWAQSAQHQTDSKAKAIVDWVESNLKQGGKWNHRRVILFTEYRTTHQWLHQILTNHGFGGDRLDILHGGMDQDERELVKAAFQTHPKDAKVRILLATDAASEGIDLQNYCNCLIHLEIPYNPNVMEQRNGRIDRHGQKESEVLIWHPVDGEAGTDAIGGHKDDIIRALTKLEAMRADMGSVNPVIAPQMAGLIEGSRQELDTTEAEAKSAKARRFVRAEQDLKEKVAKLHERWQQTQEEFHLTADRILAAVQTGLLLAEKPPLIPVELSGAPSGAVFQMPALAGSWRECSKGLEHPHTKVIRPITFDHGVAKGRDDVVLVHLNHRLVQMCLRLLRAEVWAPENEKKLHRVAVRSLPDSQLDRLAVVTVSRLVITGGNHHRLHEELTESGGYLSDTSFVRERGVTKVREWLDNAKPVDLTDGLMDALSTRFGRAKSSILQAADARSKDRLKGLEGKLESRKREEVGNITTLLDELKKSIKAELGKEDQMVDQMELLLSDFSEPERTQVRRDNAALKARLARIPEERELEVKSIEHRYADFADRTFPVAAIFLLPESMLGSLKL